jgi:hypothetical protein
LALVLVFCGAASAATIPVNQLSGDFQSTNPSVTLTPDGVHFGVYPTANSGGSLLYTGANGLTLADITDLAYAFEYGALNEPGNYTAAPYLRIFTDGADNDPLVDTDNADEDNDPTTGAADDTPDVILDPSKAATEDVPQNTLLTYDVLASSDLRVGDDAASGLTDAHMSWADVLSTQAGAHITGIYITQGFAVGTEFSANVPQMTFNDTTFDFGAPVAGPPGNTGATGGTGVAGTAGTTTIVVVQQAASQVRLIGAQLRIIHVQRRKGEKFLSARAILRGKSLTVRGRAIQVDLRNKPAGNYNVRIAAKYRTKSGNVHIVRSARNLSVTPAT